MRRTENLPADATDRARPGGDVTVDEMSEASFPASDSPATWTWEVRASSTDPREPNGSEHRSR